MDVNDTVYLSRMPHTRSKTICDLNFSVIKCFGFLSDCNIYQRSVCPSVFLFGTLVSPTKMAEWIKMSFEEGRGLMWAHGTMYKMGLHIVATW